MRHITLIIAVVALALAAPAFSGKGGVPNGGNGNGGGNGGGNSDGGEGGNGNAGLSSTTLVATPDVLRAGGVFDVSGCGYDTAYGGVIVGFTGGSWGSALDASGCFTISGIPAISGDTLAPGTYPVTAYQYVQNGQLRKTGETRVTIVP